jgi:hypothetical protein
MIRKIECIRFDRIVGYYAPHDITANPGKREEISERLRYSNEQIKEALNDKVD